MLYKENNSLPRNGLLYVKMRPCTLSLKDAPSDISSHTCISYFSKCMLLRDGKSSNTSFVVENVSLSNDL